MAGTGMDEGDDLFAPVLKSSQKRGVWLGINLLTAILASVTIGLFEDVIAQVVALAVLMPIVASMGGIAGSQTLTLMVRAMALNQITPGNRFKLLKNELGIGSLNGIAWALIIGVSRIVVPIASFRRNHRTGHYRQHYYRSFVWRVDTHYSG